MSGAVTLQGVFEAQAQAKLITYDTKFQAVMATDAPANDYLADYIYTPPVDEATYQVSMPIPLSAPELKLFKGRRHFRKNSTGFATIVKKPYDDGVEDYYKRIAAFDWGGFNTSAAQIGRIIKSWRSRNGAILMNTGETLKDWTGGNFLATTKYSNPFNKGKSTTFRTFWAATPLTVANVQLLIADMCSRNGFNGESLGYTGTVLFASNALYPQAMTVCKDATLAGAATNPIAKYKLEPEKWPQLAATRWGLIQKDAMEDHPILGAIVGSPDATVLGVGSAKYETKAYMGYNVLVDLGIAPLRYEAISVADTG